VLRLLEQNETRYREMNQQSGAAPDVSVIVPVYNSAFWLHECLNSVLRQTGVSMEIICVDDGSTDHSPAILAEYQRLSPKIKVITQPNGGLSAARNAGLAVARGRYVIFLDSDDYWYGDQLCKLVDYCDANHLDLLAFNTEPFPALGVDRETWLRYRTYYRRRHEYLTPCSGISLAAQMQSQHDYRPAAWQYILANSLVKRYHLWFIPDIIHEDNAFTFAAFLAAGRAAQQPWVFYARRVRPESIMTSIKAARSTDSLAQVISAMVASLAQVKNQVADDQLRELTQIIQKVRDYSARIEREAIAEAAAG